nr:hypothetical protein [Methanosarcina horonobensis]
MEKFAEKEGTKGDEKIQLSSCAGVAITKTKYPFYRGYELAEDLCKNAKKRIQKEEGRKQFLAGFSPCIWGSLRGTGRHPQSQLRSNYWIPLS